MNLYNTIQNQFKRAYNLFPVTQNVLQQELRLRRRIEENLNTQLLTNTLNGVEG